MTAPQKFRSALNGFNREDVVHYIEYTNARHEAEMGQLKEQLEFYRKELAVQDTTTRQAECDHLTELEEKCAALEQENEALRQQVATAVKQPSSAGEEELAAYRRAERAERLAQNRVSQMYNRANAAIADTAANLDTASAELGQVAQEAMERILALQEAVSGSKQVISDAALVLGAIRPEEEEE